MSKMFYTSDEAIKNMKITKDEMDKLIASGKLHSFRDGGNIIYKVQEVDSLINNIIDKPRKKYLECQCHSPEHTLLFEHDENDLWGSVFLDQSNSFFKRVWYAVKYIFGYKCKYGHFDCFIMKNEDVDSFIKMLQEYKELINNK